MTTRYSYHDLHITTPQIARTSICDLPYRVRVQCTRVGGWEVWAITEGHLPEELLGAEYEEPGLRLDIAGHVICDTLSQR